MSVRILQGDCREALKALPAQSVHCIVTSPPYWNLRDYGVDRQIGLEASVDEWVSELVAVFRDARRVLRDDGTLWLNLGDSYAGSRGGGAPSESSTLRGNGQVGGGPKLRSMTASARRDDHSIPRSDLAIPGLKPKDLVGQPWRVAFALQADGWYWRDTIIWAKANPMPESVTDRCTKAWEPVLMMSKSARYFFDAEAIKESSSENTHPRTPGNKAHKGSEAYASGDEHHRTKGGLLAYAERKRAQSGSGTKNNLSFDAAMAVMPGRRNKRNVWHIASEPFSEAHFATYPTALVEPCIKAGCPKGGTVLDPFGGAGTTGLVADRLQRNAILIELNPAYAEMARRRIHGDAPLFAEVA